MPVRVGFLGPLGTFTEQALLTQPDLETFDKDLAAMNPLGGSCSLEPDRESVAHSQG